MRQKLVRQEPSLANKLLIPCRNENKSQLGRSYSCATSFSYPAGLRIKLVRQEPFLCKKLFTPCRNEKNGKLGRSNPRATSISNPTRSRKTDSPGLPVAGLPVAGLTVAR